MRLHEIFEDVKDTQSALVTKIAAITNQLAQDVEEGNIPTEYTVDELLDYFRMYDVILDVTDLYNMINVPPFKGVISNIQGDNVIFKGQEQADAEAPEDENKKVVAQMAKSAMKN